MGPHALVAVTTEDPLRFAAHTYRAWEEGNAVLPMDHRLSAPEVNDILRRFRPARMVEADHVRDLVDPSGVDSSTALVIATSGTTGAPKGVEISHDALEASVTSTASFLGSSAADSWLVCLPVAHVAGLKTLFASRFGAGPPRLLTTPDLGSAVDRTDATLISMVPTQMKRLMDSGVSLRRFKAVLLGGGPIPEALVAKAQEQGIRVVRTYGMTETCGGCIYDGFPLEGVSTRIDEAGVIHLKGPMLFTGYRLDPSLSRQALVDGWFSTADLGSIAEDGELTVYGRVDDLIITGGQNVAPVEVESVIASHPKIIDCGVTGITDEGWGQRVVALVVSNDVPSTGEIRSWCAERLAAYKIPKDFLAIDVVPRSNSGKILRNELMVIAQHLLGK